MKIPTSKYMPSVKDKTNQVEQDNSTTVVTLHDNNTTKFANNSTITKKDNDGWTSKTFKYFRAYMITIYILTIMVLTGVGLIHCSKTIKEKTLPEQENSTKPATPPTKLAAPIGPAI